MPNDSEDRDLVLLVADANIEHTVKGLLSRPEAIGIRAVKFEVIKHVERDPGCLKSADLLRLYRGRYRHALVLFDREGSGRENSSREALEQDLERRLSPDWGERARVVVLDPELEAWLWSDSPHVDAVLGWAGLTPSLRSWLVERNLLAAGAVKPRRPKEAAERALRQVRKPRSSALYGELARKVSFQRCEDPSFRRMLEILRGWFPRG